MKTYNEMVCEAHDVLVQYAGSLDIHCQSDLISERVKSTGIRYFGGLSIVRGCTRIGDSGKTGVWLGRFGCGFYADTTKSSFYSWRYYYLFIKPLSAFFSWKMSRECAQTLLDLAREDGFVAVDVHQFNHPLVTLPAHLTASSRNRLSGVCFMRPDEYAEHQKTHWRDFDPAKYKNVYASAFSLINEVDFDDISFRASLPSL